MAIESFLYARMNKGIFSERDFFPSGNGWLGIESFSHVVSFLLDLIHDNTNREQLHCSFNACIQHSAVPAPASTRSPAESPQHTRSAPRSSPHTRSASRPAHALLPAANVARSPTRLDPWSRQSSARAACFPPHARPNHCCTLGSKGSMCMYILY